MEEITCNLTEYEGTFIKATDLHCDVIESVRISSNLTLEGWLLIAIAIIIFIYFYISDRDIYEEKYRGGKK